MECLRTKEDFIEFVSLLIKDLKTNPQHWKNNNHYNHAANRNTL